MARLSRYVAVALGAILLPSGSAFDWNIFGSSDGPMHRKSSTDELNADTFAQHLKDHPVTAVLFYAPWCFYSQQVMPAWDLASQKLNIHDPPVKLAKLDAHRYGNVGDKYGVNAFPMIKLFVDGTVFDFDSRQGRGWQQIVKWVNHHIDRDHVLKDEQDAEHFLHDNDLTVVGLFPDGHNSSGFQKSTRHFDDVMFAEARGTEISTKIGEQLARHASLTCETVSIGHSRETSKTVELPREKMKCESAPRNPQRPDWTDKFAPTVTGKNLEVHRSDQATSGWDQNLQLKCCDEDTDAVPKLKVPVPSIVMFMPHDERFAVYEGPVDDQHAVDKWVQARRTPMIMRLTMETAEQIFQSGPEKQPVLFLISKVTGAAEEKENEVILREAAKSLRGRVTFCVSGSQTQIERRLMDLAGADEDQLPVLTLIEAHAGDGQMHAGKKYRLPLKGLQAPQVTKFIDDYDSGSLKTWLKSEPEPTAADMSGPVGVLVGSTYTAIAHDDTKDVLVDFYAPWCGHCRKFEPLYKDLAKSLKHVKTLKITKLDATRNEVEGMQIMAFPTIVLFPGNGRPEVMYQGGRQPADIVTFLKSHCSFKFDDRPPKEAPKEASAESGLLDATEEDL